MTAEGATPLPPSAPAERASSVRITASAVITALVAALIAAGAATLIVRSRPATYLATAVIQVDQPAQLMTGGSDEVVKLAALRLKFAPLVGTDSILKPTGEAVGVSADQLRGRLVAVAPSNSLLMLVEARTGDRQDSVRFANAAASAIGKYADDEQDQLAVPQVNRYRLVVIDPARGAHQTAPTGRHELAVAAAVAVAVGLVVLGLLSLLATRRADATR